MTVTDHTFLGIENLSITFHCNVSAASSQREDRLDLIMLSSSSAGTSFLLTLD